MTMTPWNLPHGQWSKKLTMTMKPWNLPIMVKLSNFDHLTTEIPQFWPWSWSKKTNFDQLTTAISKFWPWSWSKIYDHLTMTPGRRPNGQKFMVILPPPPPPPPPPKIKVKLKGRRHPYSHVRVHKYKSENPFNFLSFLQFLREPFYGKGFFNIGAFPFQSDYP